MACMHAWACTAAAAERGVCPCAARVADGALVPPRRPPRGARQPAGCAGRLPPRRLRLLLRQYRHQRRGGRGARQRRLTRAPQRQVNGALPLCWKAAAAHGAGGQGACMSVGPLTCNRLANVVPLSSYASVTAAWQCRLEAIDAHKRLSPARLEAAKLDQTRHSQPAGPARIQRTPKQPALLLVRIPGQLGQLPKATHTAACRQRPRACASTSSVRSRVSVASTASSQSPAGAHSSHRSCCSCSRLRMAAICCTRGHSHMLLRVPQRKHMRVSCLQLVAMLSNSRGDDVLRCTALARDGNALQGR